MSPAPALALPAELQLVSVCPEFELGMPVPREAISLVGAKSLPRLLGRFSAKDWTRSMNALCHARLCALAGKGLAGAVLKARSPSCGNGDTERFPLELGVSPLNDGDGLLVLAIKKLLPELPLLNEAGLARTAELSAFLDRVQREGNRHRPQLL